MPQFQLNTSPQRLTSGGGYRHSAYHALSTFAKGYVEAMFFTNGDTGDEREFLLNELGTERLTREAIASIAKDCASFIGDNAEGLFIRQHLDVAIARGDCDEEQAGRDLWFTRQGHGIGFWGRDALTPEEQDILTQAAKRRGEAYVEVSRGWIYHR